MVTLKGWFKVETGGEWDIVISLDETKLGIQVRRCVGIWLELIVV